MDELFQEVSEAETVTIDQEADYLAELVGEGKKFKTPQDLARGKAESDRYIELLKSQVTDLQREVNTRTSLDSFKTLLEESRQQVPPVSQPSITPDDKVTLDEGRLEDIVANLLAKREAQRTQESNSQKVARVLEENFGPSAKQILNQKSREVGMSLADLQNLAARSPQAFFMLVGAQEGATRPAQTGGVPQGSHHLNGHSNIPQGSRGKSYYEKLKRDNPRLYNDQTTTLQMMSDMQSLGREKFNSF